MIVKKSIYEYIFIAVFLLVFTSTKASVEDNINMRIAHELAAIKLHPRDMDKLKTLSELYLDKGDYANALKYGKKLQVIAYDNKDYHRYVIYSHAIIGEALTLKGDKQSAFNNLGQAHDNAKSANNDSVTAMVDNALATYYLNINGDTYRSLTYLFQGLESAKHCKDSKLYNRILANISNIYYLRQDTTGLHFALECHAIGKHEDNDVLIYHSGISIAYMYYLKGDMQKAKQYICESQALMKKDEFHDRAQVYNILAAIAAKQGNLKEARSWYNRSIGEKADCSVPSIASAYLGIAYVASKEGKHNEAIDSLFRGLSIAQQGANGRSIPQILLAISHCYELKGDIVSSLNYYKKYHASQDTLFMKEKELAISDIRAKYDMAKQESLMKEQQIDLIKQKSHALLLIGLLIVAIVVATLLYMMYRRKDNLYKAIITQNKAAIMREEKLKTQLAESQSRYSSSSLSDDRKQTLYARLETLMDEEKPYHDHLLTKEKLADMLGTNRTYLSQVINEQTGQTFTAYIGGFRTKEAIKILSDPKSNTPLKALCSNVGFSSMTTFYNIFQQTTGMTPAAYRAKVVEMG